jgi:hypothetical protein
MWFSLSVVQGEQGAVKGRDMAVKRMTSAQIDEEQELARDWKAADQRSPDNGLFISAGLSREGAMHVPVLYKSAFTR